MFCSGSRFENVRAGPASYVVFGARKLTSKRSRSGNAVRSEPWLQIVDVLVVVGHPCCSGSRCRSSIFFWVSL